MNNLKYFKLFFRPNVWPVVIVIFFALLAGRHLLTPGYFNMHDDLQLMRQLSMEKCFLDFQIPCRWIPDMGYGYGYPLFNFYPPLPYLVGQAIRLIGFSFIDTVKITFLISMLGSAIGMYALTKKFFGRLAAITAAVLYTWAPYHAVDVLVRGAMNESWALVFFPLIFLYSYELITSKNTSRKTIIALSLSWFGLMTSHNLMVLVFTPIFALWCLLWVVVSKNYKKIPALILSGVFSLALSAFFTIPVIAEKDLVQTNTLVVGYYEYTAHFVSLPQLLISRYWGYGPSAWMDADDRMSFQIGWPYWIISILTILLLARNFSQKKKLTNIHYAALLMFGFGWLAAFMTHSKSVQIWQTFHSTLQYVQFPWRLLTLVIFCFSFLSAVFVYYLPKLSRIPITLALILITIVYSWSYFRPEKGKMGPLDEKEKFSGAAWELQQTAGIYDYLPVTAKTAPKSPRKELVENMKSSDVKITNVTEGTDWASFDYFASEDSTLRINTMDFPKWQAKLDGNQITKYIPDTEEWGRIYIDVPAGQHKIDLNLENTPVRVVSNIISLLAWLSLTPLLVYKPKTHST
jgi:hypothetical protein